MKKSVLFAMFLASICMFENTHNAYADEVVKGCPISSRDVIYSGTQEMTDDEFLYVGDKVYECDDEYCKDGTVFTFSNVIFKGTELTHSTTFRCKTGLSDRWIITNSDSQNTTEPDRTSLTVACGIPLGQIDLTWQYQDDDEFLYFDGKVYECDNEEGCGNTKTVEAPAGHRFKGQIVDKKITYKCVAPKGIGNDYWEPVDAAGTNGNNGNTTKTQEQKDCEAAAARGEPANWNNNVCNCGDKQVWNKTLKKCEQKSTVKNPKGPDCKSTRKTTNGKACCDLPSSAATYNATTDKCECKNGLEFEIKDGKGVCIMSRTITKCPDDMIARMQSLVRDANTKQEIRDLATQVLNMCNAPVPKMEEINNIIIIINSGIALLEVSVDDGSDDDKTVVPDATVKSHDAIVTAINGIKNVAEELDISVWKNAEGKFNTARLASDSIAGVVLGTTGGVVTSTVMKKHQVEDGFEDINCSIGGQVVAGWGDEFRVGIQ